MIFACYDAAHYEPYQEIAKSNIPSYFKQYFLHDFEQKKSMNYQSLNQDKKTHVALLVKRGKIIAQAYNKLASRSNGASSRGSQCFIHAEKNLIRGLVCTKLLRGSVIYVLRISTTNGGEFAYSQPCPECTVLLKKCIQKYGLRYVYFST